MSRETVLWRYLQKGMKDRWDACRHEDRVTTGVPDVSYGARGVQGWIELKVVDVWPSCAKTVIRIRHFTVWQKRWLTARGRRGGRTWLLLKVVTPCTFALFSWDKVHRVGATDHEDLVAAARAIWFDKIDWKEFERIVTK